MFIFSRTRTGMPLQAQEMPKIKLNRFQQPNWAFCHAKITQKILAAVSSKFFTIAH
jgi:hypothetical protein